MSRIRGTIWRTAVALVVIGSVAFELQIAPAQAQAPNWRTEFWGTELPVPAGADHQTILVSRLYLTRDDDLWIHFRYSLGPRQPGRPHDISVNAVYSASKRSLVREFSYDKRGQSPPEVRTALTALSREVDAYLTENTQLRIERAQRPSMKLLDGTIVVPDVNSNARYCIVPYNYYLSRRDAAGKQIDARMLIQLRVNPFPYRFPPDCESGNPKSDVLSVHGRDLGESIVDLGDGTWLLYDTDWSFHASGPPTVIRFRGFLESPYLRYRSDLLVVDNAEIYRTFWDGVSNAPKDTVPLEYGDRQVFERYKDRLERGGTAREGNR
jgi:hypothetical protein